MMMIVKIFTVQILCILLLIKLGDILKKKMEYLIFDDSADKRKKLIKKYAEVWDGLKNEIKAINGGEENNYRKDYIKIKFNSDDDLPLNKPLKFHLTDIIIRSVFEEGGKLYLQVVLNEALYEL